MCKVIAISKGEVPETEQLSPAVCHRLYVENHSKDHQRQGIYDNRAV